MSSSTDRRNLAKRYASAVFSLAQDKGALAAVEADFTKIQGLLEETPSLSRTLASPVVNRAKLDKLIKDILAKFGAHDITVKFLGVLSDNRRLEILAEVAAQVRALAEKARGEVGAEVVSAAPLSKQNVVDIQSALAKATGNKINVREKVDPNILGGLVIHVGSKMFDNSLASKLERLRLVQKNKPL